MKNNELLLSKLKKLNRHMTSEEILQFYLDHVRKPGCRLIQTVDGLEEKELAFWELKARADSFYVYAIGRIAISNKLPVWVE